MNSYITRPIFPFVSLYVIFFTSRHVEVFNLYGWIPCVVQRIPTMTQTVTFLRFCRSENRNGWCNGRHVHVGRCLYEGWVYKRKSESLKLRLSARSTTPHSSLRSPTMPTRVVVEGVFCACLFTISRLIMVEGYHLRTCVHKRIHNTPHLLLYLLLTCLLRVHSSIPPLLFAAQLCPLVWWRVMTHLEHTKHDGVDEDWENVPKPITCRIILTCNDWFLQFWVSSFREVLSSQSLSSSWIRLLPFSPTTCAHCFCSPHLSWLHFRPNWHCAAGP